MTDTGHRTPAGDGHDAALRHPHLQPADTTDNLTTTAEAAVEPVGQPRETGPSSGIGSGGSPDVMDDAAGFVDGSLSTEDEVPGDGTAGSRPPDGEVDVLRTARHGREEEAARADISDSTPTPTETHTP